MIKAVIFDMDGIIFDTESLVMKCWDEIGEKYQMDDIEEVALKCIGTTTTVTKQIFTDHYGAEFDYDKYRLELKELFHKHIEEDGMPIKPGVEELLSYLKENNVPVGLASSTQKEAVESELEMTGLIEYFDVLVCGDMVSKSKPEPDIFLECAKRLEVSPEDVYVIEDSYNGIRAAARANMKPIMVPDLLMPNEEMMKLKKEILHDLFEVKQYFEMLNQR